MKHIKHEDSNKDISSNSNNKLPNSGCNSEYKLNGFKVVTNNLDQLLFKSISSNSQSIIYKSDTNNNINYNSSYLFPFNNDVHGTVHAHIFKSIDYTGIPKDLIVNGTGQLNTRNALFNKSNVIKVPSKVAYALKRHIPKYLLHKIHDDTDVAIELCLLFLTQLNSTYYVLHDTEDNSEGWKPLKTEYLRDMLCVSPMTYKYVREALEHPIRTGAILECDYHYMIGEKSFKYRLGNAYVGKGLVNYELKTSTVISLFEKHLNRAYHKAYNETISRNLIEFYTSVTLPTIDEIQEEAKRLVGRDYISNKGKKLTFLNKHTKSYFKNPQELSFVEDAIKIFHYLTDNGFMIPVIGNERSGGRVVDSFALMPSWIRRLVKINGTPYTECDYSCLHPNIAIALYGGKQEYLTHGAVGLASSIEEKTVKLEHLSFFNKTPWQMRQSPLYDYYMAHEPRMLKNILHEKNISPYRHKATSRRMFVKEVEIMSDVIYQLNSEGIYVGYVYDSLFFHPRHADRVKELMDEKILKRGVKTKAKLSMAAKSDSKIDAFRSNQRVA